MKGNKYIAEILSDDYGISDLSSFDDISYKIDNYTDTTSRVKITSNNSERFCCPVYAMFDSHHMSWYGDYGFWGFNCTWKTNVMNLPYNSPYYQLEKLESRERTDFDHEFCKEEFLRLIRESDWYIQSLTEEQRKCFDDFLEDEYSDYVDIDSDNCLAEIDDICENLKALKNSTNSEADWYFALSHTDLKEYDMYEIFGKEEYELYNIGRKIPVRFFIILYMLSVVANMEEAKACEESNSTRSKKNV